MPGNVICVLMEGELRLVAGKQVSRFSAENREEFHLSGHRI